MKLLRYIFIPFLAILLMSHNTFAADLSIPVRLYTTSSYLRASYLYGSTTTNVSGAFNNNIIANQIMLYYSAMSVYDGLYLDVPVYVYNYNENNSVDGYMNINNVSCNNGGIACQLAGFSYSGSGTGQVYHAIIYVSGSGNLSNIQLYTTLANEYALRLYDSERAQPLPLTAYRIIDNSGSTGPDLTTVNTYIQYISNQLDTIYQRLGVMNGNIPSAEDIADAVNAPEEEAAEDISNQSTSDIPASDDSSATNLIGNISNIFTQIGNIPTSSTCTVAADFGNLDLGNLNFCTGKENLPFVVTFGAYCFELIFVIGTSIILVRQLLGILDWSRQ